MVEISKSEYEKMQRQIAKLAALEAGGVDNWEFYGDSLEDWHKENEVDELLQKAIDAMNDINASAEVNEPAGRGCGYSINFDEEQFKGVFFAFFEKYYEIKVRK